MINQQTTSTGDPRHNSQNQKSDLAPKSGKVVPMFSGVSEKECDQEIIRLLKNRNKEGISMLYDQFSPNVYGIISNILKNEKTACEALQSTFVKVWVLSEHTDFSKKNLRTWIIGLACREAAVSSGKASHELTSLIFH